VRRRTEEEDEEDRDNSDEEKERIKDQQARAQLEKNMREKDAANTRKVIIHCSRYFLPCFCFFWRTKNSGHRFKEYVSNVTQENIKT